MFLGVSILGIISNVGKSRLNGILQAMLGGEHLTGLV